MKKITPEKLSHYILYGLLALTAIVFLAYFLAGTVQPTGTEALVDESANSTPKLLDLLLWFIYILIFLTAGTVVGTMIRTLLIRKK